MKNAVKSVSLVLAVVMALLCLCSCQQADENYGVEPSVPQSVTQDTTVKTEVASQYVYPPIMSDDDVMPKFVDISLYDEENYADAYLGDSFILNAVYDGVKIELPISYNEIKKLGWELIKGGEYGANSTILAGKTVKTTLVNENGKKLTAYFYNTEDSSSKLKKCNIVKIKIEGNAYFCKDENCEYGKFNINGLTNNMVTTDIINIMGTPSHFYNEGENQYYFDYFVSKEDRRNGITVYVDIDDDAITAIEFALYK